MNPANNHDNLTPSQGRHGQTSMAACLLSETPTPNNIMKHPYLRPVDPGKLGQMSPMFTPCEILAAFDNARREAGGAPDEGQLLDAVLRLRPVGCSMDEEVACLRAWARVHACDAASKSGAEP